MPGQRRSGEDGAGERGGDKGVRPCLYPVRQPSSAWNQADHTDIGVDVPADTRLLVPDEPTGRFAADELIVRSYYPDESGVVVGRIGRSADGRLRVKDATICIS